MAFRMAFRGALLPLSFMASIFGMNSVEFGGDENVMHLHEQIHLYVYVPHGIRRSLLFTLANKAQLQFRSASLL